MCMVRVRVRVRARARVRVRVRVRVRARARVGVRVRASEGGEVCSLGQRVHKRVHTPPRPQWSGIGIPLEQWPSSML